MSVESLDGLIDEFIKREGISRREFARRAEKAGYPTSHTSIGKIVNRQHTGRYEQGTLDAIAEVTGYTRGRVYAAAQQRLPVRPFAEDLPEGVDYLGPDERNAVIGVIRVFLKGIEVEMPASVTPLFPDPGPGQPHPDLPSVTRYPEDDDSKAAKDLEREPGSDPGSGYE